MGWYREYETRHDMPAGYVRQRMYSQTQTYRAIEHYIEHGRCIAATIKSLSCPSRDSLSAWAEQLHSRGHARVVGRTPELAPKVEQSAVVALCLRPGGAQEMADDVGVSRGLLYKWKNKLLGLDAPGHMKRQHAKWLTDITEFQIPAGVYLSSMID